MSEYQRVIISILYVCDIYLCVLETVEEKKVNICSPSGSAIDKSEGTLEKQPSLVNTHAFTVCIYGLLILIRTTTDSDAT